VATVAQRGRLAALMDELVAHAAAIHYRQVRPMRTHAITSRAMLERALLSHAGVTMDCSESVTLLCRLAGLKDPNGFGYDGTGYTGTLLKHLPHYTNPRKAKIGALVVFGPGSGDHVCMVRRPGPNPVLFSHGSERGPLWISLEQEKKWQADPTTFLAISKL
jgi:hypothetical protein